MRARHWGSNYMGRLYFGKYRLLVKFHWPSGEPGFDWTSTPDEYDECAKVALVLGAGTPWEVTNPSTGKAVKVRVEGSLIIGPIAGT